MASLRVTSDQGEEKHELGTAALTIGRGLESEVRLKDIKASRRHCQVLKTPTGYKCLDLSSGNGTYINGVQIKEQDLNPGDKIQIGSTTITFESAAAPAAAAPAKAAARPATRAAAAAPTAKAKPITARAGKPTTGKVPVAGRAAKPTTGKVPIGGRAGKPTTGKVPIADAPTKITGRVRKGTQAIGKGGKGRKPTGRTTGSFGKASQRFHAEARKPKTNQFKVVIIGIIVIFLGVVGFILFGGGEDPKILRARFDKLQKEANQLEVEFKFEEAIAKLTAAIALVKEEEGYKTATTDLKGRIKTLEMDIANMKKIEEQFQGYKTKFQDENLSTTDLNTLRRQVKSLQKSIKDAPVAWKKDVDVLIERIDKMLDTAKMTRKREDFQNFRNEALDKFKLNDKEAEWGPAIASYKDDYLSQSGVTSDNKQKAEAEMRRLEDRAVGDVKSCKKRADRLNQDNMKAMAIEYLKSQRPRFAGAGEAESLLEEYIKELDR